MLRTLLLLLLFAAACLADVTGTWSVEVQTDMGTGTPVFTFKQDGEKLTGTYSGQLGEAKVAGTLKGDAIEFWFEAAPAGEKLTVKYSGKLEGENRMKGTVDLGGLARGTFTGAKK